MTRTSYQADQDLTHFHPDKHLPDALQSSWSTVLEFAGGFTLVAKCT